MPISIATERPLTQARLRELLHYDPQTGAFTWVRVEVANQVKVGDRAGTVDKTGRASRKLEIDAHSYKTNRLAWFWMTGEWPAAIVDHKDRDPNNDAWDNLRLATFTQNLQNSRLRSDNTSGVKGVYWARRQRRWQASIRVEGKGVHLGYFDTIEAAAEARRAAELRYFGEFAPA